MPKKYTIEVPLYARPVERLAELNRLDDISIAVFGGFPNASLNGGRLNYSLDGLFLWDRMFFSLSTKQLDRVRAKFYATVARINGYGMSFRLAYTNMFVAQEELNEDNFRPLQWLVDAGEAQGVKNGVILNNALLEGHLRQRYGNKLVYISSCTRYVAADRLLTPSETMAMYEKDSGQYDFIVVTPQDSRRAGLLKEVVSRNKSGIIAIANSYCSNDCNSYHHYACMNKENKVSLLKLTDWRVVSTAIKFIMPHAFKCAAFRHFLTPVDVEGIAAMQLDAGVVNFKLGRGFGVEGLEKLIAVILRHKEVPFKAVAGEAANGR